MPTILFNPVARKCCENIVALASLAAAASTFAAPAVEFDFTRAADVRDVTPPDRRATFTNERLIEIKLPVSVRFHDAAPDDVDELVIEVSGAAAGLRVVAYSPTTQLATDVTQAIETTTTSRSSNSLDATLGGTLPTPYSELVAHLTPSITASTSRGDSATEKITRLPPRYAVVVSGTALEGRGAFFKLKRSSQTSLEGVHPLAVTFIAPADWQAGTLRVACTARGQRKLLFVKQEGTLGRAAGEVKLRVVRDEKAIVTAASAKCTEASPESN